MSEIVDLLAFERKLYEQGIELIAGVDEVGRGPLAGPVVAAAVILPRDEKIMATLAGVNDSKQISAKKRAAYYQLILTRATAVGVGSATVAEIDEMNILNATKLAMKRAIAALTVEPNYLLIDFLTLNTKIPEQGIVKGDAKSLSIAAASIVAKEVRDQYMAKLDADYPAYGFASNAGYGTKKHKDALAELGYIEGIHRQSFEPIKSMVAAQRQGSLKL